MKSGLVSRAPAARSLCCRIFLERDSSLQSMAEPSPYKIIAVATTFSPRFREVLAEAKRIRERFPADLHLIYVGERNEEMAGKFTDALAALHLPANSAIHYEEGD